ncbi:MAG: STAS/SEC14 domain-containing protein [Bacteroidia bacterium]|nr:STAS/SEC14 domain-containing protein [Bacteroidia bacterium]
MPLELSYIIQPYFLEVEIQGGRTTGREFEEMATIWGQVFQISKKESRYNILAHVRVKERLPVNTQINISFKVKEIGCTHSHRIAVFVNNKEVLKSAELIERYMHEEGYSVQLFNNKDRARRWLLREKKRSRILDLLDSFD